MHYCVRQHKYGVEIQHEIPRAYLPVYHEPYYIYISREIPYPSDDLTQNIMIPRPFVLLLIPVQSLGKNPLVDLFKPTLHSEYADILSGAEIRIRADIGYIFKLSVKCLPVVRHIPHPLHFVFIDIIPRHRGNSDNRHQQRIQHGEYAAEREHGKRG